MVTNEVRTIENLRMREVSIPVQHGYRNKIQTMPAKSLGTPLLILPALFCDFPLSPLEQCCFVVRKSGCQDDARLCWNGRTITFEINIVSGARGYLNLIIMVRSADYEETAYVFQGLLAGIVAEGRLLVPVRTSILYKFVLFSFSNFSP